MRIIASYMIERVCIRLNRINGMNNLVDVFNVFRGRDWLANVLFVLVVNIPRIKLSRRIRRIVTYLAWSYLIENNSSPFPAQSNQFFKVLFPWKISVLLAILYLKMLT